MIKGIVSGHWNPPHLGHIEYINAAKSQCDELIIICNNDIQVHQKGRTPYMRQEDRVKFMSNLKSCDKSILAIDQDKTVCKTLIALKKIYYNDELIFFNSGDRVDKNNTDSNELKICEKYNIKYVAIPLPKIYSSSKLISDVS